MSSFDRAAALLSDAVARSGPYAPVILFGASFIEYVFPPFPGDAIVLLGAWYAAHGVLSWPAAFVAVTAGAVAGAWVDWRAGRALAPALEARASTRGLSAERLARFDAAYRKYGGLLLVVNRFLPGVRAFLFLAAGAARLPLGRVLLLGGVSAALWNALLLAVGALVAKNAGEMAALFERYTTAAWCVLAALALAGVAVLLLRRRRRA